MLKEFKSTCVLFDKGRVVNEMCYDSAIDTQLHRRRDNTTQTLHRDVLDVFI